MHPKFSLPPAEHVLTEKEAAAFLDLSCRTLQRLRTTGEGPTYRRLGKRRVCYLRADLLAYLEPRGFTSTSNEGYRRSRSAEPVKVAA